MPTHTRREFLIKAAQGAALAACGGCFWAYLLRQEARGVGAGAAPTGRAGGG